MQANKKIMLFLIVSVLIFLLAGCPVLQEPIEVILKPDFTEGQQSSSLSKRFQESAPRGPTIVESAIELSEKYARLSEEMAVLQQKNHELIAESRRLKDRLTPCETQLKQTQKELAEANDFLIEMRIELNNWKTDILGFRNEMRDADKAQLETLLKILKILGGEVKEESQNENEGSDIVPANEHSQSQPLSHRAVTTLGKPNE